MGTPPFCYGKVGAGVEAQSGELRAQGKTPALFFQTDIFFQLANTIF